MIIPVFATKEYILCIMIYEAHFTNNACLERTECNDPIDFTKI